MLASRYVFCMLAAAAPLSAQKQTPGWTYTMNMTTDSGAGVPAVNIATRYSVTDSKLRQEFVQVAGMREQMSVEGMYMIMSVADSTMTTVMPNQHAAAIAALPSSANVARIKFASHVTTSIEDLGDGGRLFGHATRHYRVTMSGTIDRTTSSGRVCTTPADGVNDMWIAPDLDLMPAMKLVLKQFGITDLDSLARQSASTALPKGLALRMIMRHGNVTSTMEYRDIAQTTFEPSYFDVPAGFTKMDLRKLSALLPQATLDSIQKAVEEKSSGGCTASSP